MMEASQDTVVVVHYECESGDHYYRELKNDSTVGDVQRIVSGDAMTAQMLLHDSIVEVDTLELTLEEANSIPHDHPDWEKFLGEKWKIVDDAERERA